MAKFKIKLLIIIFLQAHFTIGFEPDICGGALLLKNGLISVKSAPPNIEVEVPKVVKSGEKVTIKIKGLKNVRGLAVQARTQNDAPVGKFSPDIHGKHTNCHGISKSMTIYRTSPSDTETEISWKAPTIKEAINFRFQ